jgi:hypothetical protein
MGCALTRVVAWVTLRAIEECVKMVKQARQDRMDFEGLVNELSSHLEEERKQAEMFKGSNAELQVRNLCGCV